MIDRRFLLLVRRASSPDHCSPARARGDSALGFGRPFGGSVRAGRDAVAETNNEWPATASLGVAPGAASATDHNESSGWRGQPMNRMDGANERMETERAQQATERWRSDGIAHLALHLTRAGKRAQMVSADSDSRVP